LISQFKTVFSSLLSLQDCIPEALSRTGALILLAGASTTLAFGLAAVLVPIPAMRALSWQAAALAALNSAVSLALLPATLALDAKWAKTSLGAKMSRVKIFAKELKKDPSAKEEKCDEDNLFASAGRVLTRPPVKLLVAVAFLALTAAGAYGASMLRNGLDLTEVVPRDTGVHRFLKARSEHFGFYRAYAVTGGNVEYPASQKLLADYAEAFVRVPAVVKDDNGGLPDQFWLSLFRAWLVRLQEAFDEAKANDRYDVDAWHANASDDAVLAFKLMVQTGHVDHPVEMSFLETNRLVDAHGVINQNAFYNYLTAWYSADAMAYSYSEAELRPKPKEWIHVREEMDLRVPKSQPVAYAQIPFYVDNVAGTDEVVAAVEAVRRICREFEVKGLPNFPRGVPFTFWEQYVTLRFWLGAALAAMLTAAFLVLAVNFASLHAAALGVFVLLSSTLQQAGLMGMMGVKLSAIPAVVLVASAGLTLAYLTPVLVGFATSVGQKDNRVQLAVAHLGKPVLAGALGLLLSLSALAFSEFDFVFRHFFASLASCVVLALFNGLIFTPVLLSSLGWPGEIAPKRGDTIQPPSPPPPRPQPTRMRTLEPSSRHQKPVRTARTSRQKTFTQPPKRHNSDSSLSTIPEESHSYASSVPKEVSPHASVFVEPEISVEQEESSTKVTAKFKVEVHSAQPLRRSKRRRNVDQDDQESSSLPSSVTSSVSSSNSGDLGFSEK